MSLTKKDLIAKLSDETGFSRKDTENMVDTLAATISEQLVAGEEFTLPGVGKFSTSQREARTGRNPQTGESIEISASVGVKFSASKTLKDQVNA
ncbi:HU family DNA-binding protein [Bordetella pseudohinzii]|uniref:DNA-binding protein n=1 Tax=Bordetella pseudohinzii TaxID=1331258 RepID=A0A0J6BTK2_9BORD|nr:HU family DNA-binding protein [Bordetella pseudohinzii]ANY15930.1 DNA-binding protein [Bordetella pseudohinzii]KMM25169.1 DNA-binding protein [Bordetella pseudohinzii]KXA75914.1 DNA-binding protein [Bordetella pseudohinzii]KXA78964.1 DNA-binding protein [Bordetella pseudohinzii]CUI46049.1 DNA-binding protein HRm [Bordetella pseudohinzii]